MVGWSGGRGGCRKQSGSIGGLKIAAHRFICLQFVERSPLVHVDQLEDDV